MYMCGHIVVCVHACDVHPVIIEKSNLPALQLPSPQQLERGEPEFSMSTCSVTVRTCEKSDSGSARTHFMVAHGVKIAVVSLLKRPTDPFTDKHPAANGSFAELLH